GVRQARAGLAQAGIRLAAADAQRRPTASRRTGPRPDPVLRLHDLWVERGEADEVREVLRGIDLAVAPGERVALMGRNGAGKSTLLRAAAGLIEPVRGRAETPGGIALLTQSPADYLVRERVGDELPGEAGRQALTQVGLAGL